VANLTLSRCFLSVDSSLSQNSSYSAGRLYPAPL
jgi:hypothetical protein